MTSAGVGGQGLAEMDFMIWGDVMTAKRVRPGKKFSMRLLPSSVLESVVVSKKGAPWQLKKAKVKGLKSFAVSRSSATGQLIINGVPESELVNKFPGIEISKASVKPKHLTVEQIHKIVAAMKVAS